MKYASLTDEYLASSRLQAALLAVARADDRRSSVRATETLIDAVGNNHAGTYLPVVLVAAEAAGALLQNGNAWVQRAVLEALIDLCGSFEPDPACVQFQGASLAASLQQRVLALVPRIQSIARGACPAAGSAADLLEVLEPKVKFER